MKDYIEESIDLVEEEIIAKVSSPENKGLQNMDDSSSRLQNKDVDILHYIVAKIPYVEKYGRPNIETAISLLCTIVTKSTKEDKAKLSQALQ